MFNKKRALKAQSGTEFLIIAGFAFFMLAPLTIFAYTQISSQQQQIRGEQLFDAGRVLIDASQQVFFQGEPAKLTVQIYMPGDVTTISVAQRELVFFYQTSAGTDVVTVQSPVNLTGTIPNKQGRYFIEVIATPTGANLQQR